MKLLPRRPIFLFPSSSSSSSSSPPYPSLYSFFVSHFSTFTQLPSPYRRLEDESRYVKVSVWWDFENCTIPAGVNVSRIAHSIAAAIRVNGMKGPVQITAFGDVSMLSRPYQEALYSTGINLVHIPQGGENSADRSLIVDLMYWVSQNPPPAHLFLISGERGFASILHRLRMRNYNVLLASPESAPVVLYSAASIMWHWNTLVRGENLSGKYFNQPPDGPYGSWYGQYKVPLEDPFSVNLQPVRSQVEELAEPDSNSKPHQVPMVLVDQIRHILNLYPKGISITGLREELRKSNVCIDKDFYGYKKFSLFLLSMPNILRLQNVGDGQFCIRGTAPEAPQSVESKSAITIQPVSDNENWALTSNSKLHKETSATGAVHGKSSLPKSKLQNETSGPGAVHGKSSLPKSKLQNETSGTEAVHGNSSLPKSSELRVEESPIKAEEPPPLDKKVAEEINARATEEQLSYVEEQKSSSEVGFFRKIWRKWFSSKDGSPEKESNRPEKCGTYDGSPEKIKSEEENVGASPEQVKSEKKSVDAKTSEKIKYESKCVNDRSQHADPIERASILSSNNLSSLDKKFTKSSETCGDKSIASSNFFNKVINWCKFRRTSAISDISNGQSRERLNEINTYSKKHDCFSEDSFWTDMESFIATPKGSILIFESRTREQMAQNLRKDGPLVLRSLTDTDLLHLVDLLISDKKWIEECPSQPSPFKVLHPVGKSSCSSQSHISKGLSSIFLSAQARSNLQKQPEHNGEKAYQNLLHPGVSQPVVDKISLDRPRSEILVHCQKLVNEILKEQPERFNLGAFRRLFLERYGYALDIRKLGYQNLASLLQIMPGVKIESTYLVPSCKVSSCSVSERDGTSSQENNAHGGVTNSDSELSDASRKEDDLDSPWKELGPVADTNSDRNEMGSDLCGKRKKGTVKQMHFNYQSLVSDDDLSESEGEASPLTRTEGQEKPKLNKEDSSLLQVLDSWYKSKENDNRGDALKIGNADSMIDCSSNDLKPSGSDGLSIKNETSPITSRQKHKPVKNYSFVLDPEDDRNKLIDGILGSLKKSAESKMHS